MCNILACIALFIRFFIGYWIYYGLDFYPALFYMIERKVMAKKSLPKQG